MNWSPAITVATVVERDGKFLIVEERIAGQRVFNQPAGHVEDGESILAAVVRETREETAWQFEPEHLIGVYSWRNLRKGPDTIRFAFTGRLHSHDSRRQLDQPILATHWLSRAELLQPERALRTPMVLRCIDDYLDGRRLPLTLMNEVSPV